MILAPTHGFEKRVYGYGAQGSLCNPVYLAQYHLEGLSDVSFFPDVAGLPLVTIGGEHITVDLIEFSVSPTLERVREGVVSLVCAFMTGVLSYQMWLKALEQLDYGDETAVLQIPVYPVTFFMCLTAALTCLVLVVLAFQQVFGSRNAPASVAH